MKLYKNLQELFKDYANVTGKKQCVIADLIGIDETTWRRWIKKNPTIISDIRDENLINFSKRTLTPLEVLFRLKYSYHTLYDFKTKRYALNAFDIDLVNEKIIRKKLYETDVWGKIKTVMNQDQLKEIWEFTKTFYPYKKKLDDKLILESCALLEKVNVIILDPHEFNCGHLLCFPLKMASYKLLKNKKKKEFDLNKEDLERNMIDNPVALHIFSFFTINSFYSYCILKRVVDFLLVEAKQLLHPESVVSRYALTRDGIEFCRKFGLEEIFRNNEDHSQFNTETPPTFFSKEIKNLAWLSNYKDSILL